MKTSIGKYIVNLLLILLLTFLLYVNISYYVFGQVSLAVVNGRSMYPLLHSGDVAIILPFKNIRLGDIIIFRNDADELVIHRVIAILECDNGSKIYITKGDNNPFNDIDSGIISRKSVSCNVTRSYVLKGYEQFVRRTFRGIALSRIVGKVMSIDGNIIKITGLPVPGS